MPLKPDELDKDGLMQFPMVMGGVVPVVNLPGISPGQLKLDGKTLAEIYLGKITKWNDPAIAALNPGLNLPRQGDRAGPSLGRVGHHLHLHPLPVERDARIRRRRSARTPRSSSRAGSAARATRASRRSPARTDGAIGYVEYAYALQNKLTYALLQNNDGAFVAPTVKAFQAAAANADWAKAPGFYLLLTNQPGKDSWPITGATFILMHKEQDKPERRAAGARLLRLGLPQRWRSWPRASTTCRCRRQWSATCRG